ncbi:ubiquitin-specific protease otu1 [Parahypoxylon ruwenzoriense]
MKVRYKAPSGGGSLELDDSATVGQLLESIKASTGYAEVMVKYGWPPKALDADQGYATLQSLGLQRESFTVVPVETSPPAVAAENPQPAQEAAAPVAFPGGRSPQTPKGTLDIADQNISVRMSETNSYLAVGGALKGLPTAPDETLTPTMLRQIVVDHIRANPEKYTAAVLDKDPELYCARMLQKDTWGGEIELDVLSEVFQLEICVINVQHLNVYRVGEGRDMRCVLVYSNIHYDRVAEVFNEGQAVADFDITRWAVDSSDHVVAHARELCRKLRDEHHYYTDTNGMVVSCNQCHWIGQGKKAYIDHSLKTGHTEITEIADT